MMAITYFEQALAEIAEQVREFCKNHGGCRKFLLVRRAKRLFSW